MSTTRTTSSLSGTIPALSDTADIVAAFSDYHDSLANTSTGAAVLARANTFGGASGATQTVKTADGGSLEVSTVNASKNGVSIIATDNAGYPVRLRPILSGTAKSDSEFYYDGTNDRWVSEPEIYSAVELRPGANTPSVVIPLKFNSGTNLSTIVAGAMEYDGNLFYATPKVNNTTAGRGLLTTQNVLFLASNNTQSVSVSSGTAGPTEYYALNKSLYLAASQRYFVEMSIRVAHTITIAGSGSSTISFGMKGPNTTTYMMDTQSQVDMATLATAGTPSFEYLSGLGASKTIKSSVTSSDSGYSIFKWSGIVDVGTTAGNFGPALTLTSVNSGSSTVTEVVVQAGSYCKVTPLGPYSSEVNIGGWA
jgi:hypothetical protein